MKFLSKLKRITIIIFKIYGFLILLIIFIDIKDFFEQEYRLANVNSRITNNIAMIQNDIKMYQWDHNIFPIANNFSDLEKVLATQFDTVYMFSYESDWKYYIIWYPELLSPWKSKCKFISNFPNNQPNSNVVDRICEQVVIPKQSWKQ